MKIDSKTDLYGLIGHPVSHSVGPAVHNAAFRAVGLNSVYITFDTEYLEQCISGMRAFGIKGLSVTIPHKEAILPFLDHIEDLAMNIGAVNTVVNSEGKIMGFNTDASGAIGAVKTRMDPRNKRALVLGAGGAARAIAFALMDAGAHVYIANRSEQRGRALAGDVRGEFVCLPELNDLEADLLVQATPVGMKGGPEGVAFPEVRLRREMTVMETVYNPLDTKFVLRAREKGCHVINGLEMFIRQAAAQFRLWTGMEPPLMVMRTAAEKEL